MQRTVCLLFILSCFLTFNVAHSKTELGGGKSKVSTIDLSSSSSAWDFRKTHRVGMNLVAAGVYGVAGGSLELNFTPAWTFGIGVGRGDPFQSVVASLKRYSDFWDSSWLPYLGVNFARWENFGSTEVIQETSPGYLGATFLSDADRAKGKIRSTLMNPTLGFQYIQLTGDWRGFMMSVELGFIAHLTGPGVIPSGAFQFGYVF